MGQIMQDIKDEFHLWKFMFQRCPPTRFYWCKTVNSSIPLMIFRCAAFIFAITILSLTLWSNGSDAALWQLAAFTVWSYIMLTLYFFTASLISVFYVYKSYRYSEPFHQVAVTHERNNPVSTSEESIIRGEVSGTTADLTNHEINFQTESVPWFLITQWCLYNIALPAAILVTIVYWGALYPMLQASSDFHTNFIDVSLHAVNSAFMITEQYLGALPTRILHVYQPILYAIVYMIFSGIYWHFTGIILYPYILDWTRPGITTASLFGILLYFIVAQLVFFLLYRLQKYSCRNVHGDD
ncbi:uncharacterized protein [Watersipora subatra]|uniref:uncharacterized protein isoform X2 n=1 Tax=Watersipora subatra TaxID=2589382 RepID=UPI00355C17D7